MLALNFSNNGTHDSSLQDLQVRSSEDARGPFQVFGITTTAKSGVEYYTLAYPCRKTRDTARVIHA